MSSAMISSGLPALLTASSSGIRFFALEIFSSWIRTRHFSNSTVCWSWLVTKCGERKPRSNCMPSTTSTVVSACLPSSTVITPFLPTLTKASASTAPIVGSLLPAMVATWAISFLSFSLTGDGHLLDRLDHGVVGGVDAAAQGHRIGPGGHHPQPFEIDRLGQQRGGRGAVAGHVAGLRGRFLDQLGAEVLEGVVQVDLLGHGDAVLGDLRRAPALVEHGVSAAGAQRADHGPGQLAHPGGQRLPSFVFKDQLFCHSGFLLLLAILRD